MRVRIQRKRPTSAPMTGCDRILALALATMLAPAALTAFTMGCWRLASDRESGMFSHWQAWLAAAAVLLASVSALDRYGRGGGETIS